MKFLLCKNSSRDISPANIIGEITIRDDFVPEMVKMYIHDMIELVPNAIIVQESHMENNERVIDKGQINYFVIQAKNDELSTYKQIYGELK